MKSKELFRCEICDEMHDDYNAATSCCNQVSCWYECTVCHDTHRREEAADECCAEAKATAEIDPLSRPAFLIEKGETAMANLKIESQKKARRLAIFAACRAARLDDDARRQVVLSVTGCTSLTECNVAQLGAVLDHLNRSKGGYQGRRRVAPSPERAPLLSKIDALLAELHRVTGRVHPLAYADGVARRVCKRTSLDFCDPEDLKKIVAALSNTLRHQIAKSVP